MTITPRPSRSATTARTLVVAATLAGLLVGGCVLDPTPSPTLAPSPSPTRDTTSEPPSAEPTPTATPLPEFTLEPPDERDPRQVSVTIEAEVGDEEGEVLVTVTSHADELIDEIVLRWATPLDDILFLAPFVPSPDRIREGGPPLVQDWTKWVVGPGERGEPAGTTSLGYGPLLAGATLAIPLAAQRLRPGPVEFDLQLLAGNALLELELGGDAHLRVEVP